MEGLSGNCWYSKAAGLRRKLSLKTQFSNMQSHKKGEDDDSE